MMFHCPLGDGSAQMIAYDSLTINDEGFGHASHTPCDTERAIMVWRNGCVGVAITAKPREGVFFFIFIVDGVDRHMGELL